ncbi:unnamed protein product [Rhizophagus irregularis]|uniref:AIG1-type G domain-containing protein n=2 Tax=Rhizophagus irregularis TaxID=588596 RepID=A0A916EBE4_9GLOM|nr:unnamed protein product [Rhizophagus irregularis]CAB4489889.1 unnamed protein product [Rhizophagus irregularis]CAB5187629.1 unnamed protein product [Rhizophagus irregularis]CAB5377516.1 unnamed protein product [Rhizophagus irregularis]
MSGASSLQRCILAVGNTGNGKSFTATIFGAQNVKIGHSSKSETDTITIYGIKGGFYIDTPGFDDSDEYKNDDETVRSIFRKMMEAKIQDITTILWFVVPDARAKGSYKRQARFIESLAKYYKGNVWDNTIIVTKGDKIENGPRDAANEIALREHNKDNLLSNTGEFKILLYESLLPTDVYVQMGLTSERLNTFGVFKGSEPERILAKYESFMDGHLKHPIGLNLRVVKCSKCFEETDPRLAFPECHLETESFHPNVEDVHRGNVIVTHPSSHYRKHSDYYVEATTRQEFDDSPQAWTVRVVTFGILNPTRPAFVSGYWKCCHNKNANSPGCKQVYHCCGRDYQSPGCQKIYDECKHKHGEAPCLKICKNCKKISDAEGCKTRCKNCKNDNPRNTKGCIKVSHNFPIE